MKQEEMMEKPKPELTLAEAGFGLTEPVKDKTTSLVVAALQHLSGKPWIVIDINHSIDKDQCEWYRLTEEIGNEASFKLLLDISRARENVINENVQQKKKQRKERMRNDDIKKVQFSQLSLISASFQKTLTIHFVNSSLAIKSSLHVTSSSCELSSNKWTGKNFFEAHTHEDFQPSNQNVFIYESESPYFDHRLISPVNDLHPDKVFRTEKMIDQLSEFGLIRQAVQEYYQKENLHELLNNSNSKGNLMQSTEVLDKIGELANILGGGRSFAEIWASITKTHSSPLLSRLFEAESTLDLNTACELRVRLSQLIAKELYYPVRSVILKEKNRMENDAEDFLERRRLCDEEAKEIQGRIQHSEKELLLINEKYDTAEKSTKDLQKKMEGVSKMSKKDQEEMKRLTAKINEMKETAAFNDFMNQIQIKDPKDCQQILEEIGDEILPNIDTMSLREIGESLSEILDIPETVSNSEHFISRMEKNSKVDKEQICQALDVMMETPQIEIDGSGDLSVSGRNIILSSVMPQMLEALERNSPKQVKVTCLETLLLDTSFENYDFSGVNIILVSKNIVVADSEIEIDVSGINGEDRLEDKAKDGQNEGSAGENGEHGNPGTDSGNVHIEALESFIQQDKLHIICNGGNGSNGQDGGDGQRGRNGADGKHGEMERPGWVISTTKYYYQIDRGKPGEPGQLGGNGGAGGRGGRGGRAGNFLVKWCGKDIQDSRGDDGKKGGNGVAGKAGATGSHGKHGTDHGWAKQNVATAWKELRAYNIKQEENSGYILWVLVVFGYFLKSGKEPEIITQQVNQRVNAMEKSKETVRKRGAEMITSEVVNSMISRVDSAATSNLKAESGESKEKAELEKELAQVSSKLDSKNQQNSQLEKQMESQMAEISQIKQQKEAQMNSMKQMSCKHEAVAEATRAAQRESAEAELRAKQLHQMAANAKQMEEQSLSMIGQMQQQNLVQSKNEQETMVLQDARPDNSTDASSPEKSSGERDERLRKVKRNLAATREIMNVLNLVDSSLRDSLEHCMQLLNCNSMKDAKELIDFFNKADSNATVRSYLKNDFPSELKLILRNKKLLEDVGILGKSTSLTKFAVDTFNGKTPINKYHDKLTEEMKQFFRVSKLRQIYNNFCSKLKTSPDFHSPALKGLPISDQQKFMTNILDEAFHFFPKLMTAFDKQFEEFEIFLQALVDFMGKETDISKLSFKSFLQEKYDLFSSKKLKREVEKLSKSTSTGDMTKYSERVRLIISGADFEPSELDSVLQTIRKAKNDKNDLEKVEIFILDDMENKVGKIFEKLREKLPHKEEEKEKVGKLLSSVEKLTKSRYRKISFKDRLETCSKLLSKQLISAKDLEEIFRDAYEKYSDTGFYDKKTHCVNFMGILQFLKEMEKSASSSQSTKIDSQKLEALRVLLENGSISKGSPKNFSKGELCLVEKSLKNCLNDSNMEFIGKLQQLVQNSPSIDFETSTLYENCNLENCSVEIEKILCEILEFLEVSYSEGGRTDAKKIHQHIRFILTHVEIKLIKSSLCGKVVDLRESLAKCDRTNPEKIIECLQKFRNDILQKCNEQDSSQSDHVHEDTNETIGAYLDRWGKIVSEKTDLTAKDINTLFLHGLKFVSLKTCDFEKDHKEKLEKLQKDVGSHITSSDAKSNAADRAGKLISYFLNLPTANHPIKDLYILKDGVAKVNNENWLKLQNLCKKMDRLLQTLRTHKPLLFLAAQFSKRAQDEIIDKANLINVGEMCEIFEVISDISELSPATANLPISLALEQTRIQATLQNLPLLEELTWLCQAFYPRPQDRDSKMLDILREQLDSQIGKKSLEELWTNLKNHFENQKNTTSKMWTTQLAKSLIGLPRTDPRFMYVLRMLRNLVTRGNEMGKGSGKIENLDKLLGEAGANVLTNNLKENFLFKMLLKIEEQRIFSKICEICEEKVVEEEMKKMLNGDDEKKKKPHKPSAWQGYLERLYFNKTFHRMTRSLVEVTDVLRDSVQLLVKSESRVKFRAVRLYPSYEQFQLTYYQQQERFHFLQVINKMLDRVDKTGFEPFGSPWECRIILTLMRQLSLQDVEEIAEKRFPHHWMKWLLIKCILADMRQLNCKSDEISNLETELISFLTVSNLTDYPTRLYFLLCLHPELQKNVDAGDPVSVSTVRQLLLDIKTANFSVREMKSLNSNISLYPISYWQRLIRIRRIQKVFTESVQIAEILLQMDEDFSNELINKLISVFDKSGKDHGLHSWMSLEEVENCLWKFKSMQWILDDGSLELLRNSGDWNGLEEKMQDYAKDQRGVVLEMKQILEKAGNLPLNRSNWSIISGKVKERLEKVFSILNNDHRLWRRNLDGGKMAIDEIVTKEELESNFENFKKSWKSKYEKLSWTNSSDIDENLICETLALIYRAIQLAFAPKEGPVKTTTMSPRVAQLVSVLLMIDGIGRGKLGEIETGEGKSCIVAMFAAFCSLMKAHVHVISSNKLLAKDDCEKNKGFFKLLDLTADNNCDDKANGDSVRKKRYNNNIVYGELSGFQADILNTEFNDKGIMECQADILIVDEVDSLVLDKGANMLYLSHQIPELKHIRPVLLLVWDTVQSCWIDEEKKIENPSKPYTDQHVYSVHEAVKKRLVEKKAEIQVPKCLDEFIQSRLGIWVKQAFVARFMPRNDSFIVDEKQHRIVNMDNDTGVEQGNVHLSLGLHQFLQMKYKTKLSPESLKCVYMSNMEYFKRHEGKLFGISGTLGGEEETKLIQDIYNVDFFAMPRYKTNCRIEKPPKISVTEESWLKNIYDSVKEHVEVQPVLIVTQNLVDHAKILEAVTPLFEEPRPIWEYKSSETDESFTEKVKKAGGMRSQTVENLKTPPVPSGTDPPPVVVITTNLGGRGTDLKVHEACKEKGLHVILSYLPNNARIEKQAFGRTARAGENGTVEFVIQAKAKGAPDADGNEHIPTMFQLKEERRRREAGRLDMIRKQDIKKIEMEDDLFKEYAKFVSEVKTSKLLLRHRKRVRVVQIEFLKNRWAVWLDSLRPQLDCLHLQRKVGEKRILEDFEKFQKEQCIKLESGRLEGFAEFPSELIKLGSTYETIAMKTFVGSLINAEYGNAVDAFSEGWESVKYVADNVWTGIKAGWSNSPEKMVKLFKDVNETLQQNKQAPTDLEAGLEIFRATLEKDENFSYPAVAYSGALEVYKKPDARNPAKKSLKELKKRLISRMESNSSNIIMLNEAAARMGKNDEGVTTDKDLFMEQVQSENNLLSIHLDAINTALGFPITAQFIKAQIQEVDTDDDAKNVLDFLLEPEWDLLKDYRVSNKFYRNPEDFMSKIRNSSLPCSIDDLKSCLESLVDKPVDESDFEGIVVNRLEMLEYFKEHGFLEDVPVYVVSITEESYEDGLESFRDGLERFRDGLEKLTKHIADALYENRDKIFDPDTMIPSVVYEEEDEETKISKVKFTKFLLDKVGWLREENLPLKLTDKALNYYQLEKQFKDEGAESKSLNKKIKAFFTSPIYQIYDRVKNFLQDEGIPWWDQNLKERVKYDELSFPLTNDEGASEIFKFLIYAGILKEPKVNFPSLKSGNPSKRAKEIETLFESEKFQSEVETLYESLQLKKHEKCDEFRNQLKKFLLDSVGTLKQFKEVRPNYECISTKVPVDENQCVEELQDLLQEGTFTRLVLFDEYVRWYQNIGASLIFLLGVAEIGAGIAVEILSGGTLSPLAAMLLSEGGSDIMYSVKHLYRGQRVDRTDYWRYKKQSLVFSGTTALFGVASIGTGIFREIAKQIGKASLKALLFHFIEENIEKGLRNNALGLFTMLDDCFKDPFVEAELKKYEDKGIALWEVTWLEGDAQRMIEKVIDSTVAEGSDSFFGNSVSKTAFDLRGTIFQALMKNLMKDTMPIIYSAFSGFFASNEKLTTRCHSNLQELLLLTLQHVNEEIEHKIENTKKTRECLHLIDASKRCSQEEMKNCLELQQLRLREELKKRLANEIYKSMTLFSMKRKLHESIRSGYSRMLNDQKFGVTDLRIEEVPLDFEKKTVKKVNSADENQRLVINARGRNIAEVKKRWKDTDEEEDDLYFINSPSNHTCVAFIRSDLSLSYNFILPNEPSAFDDYLNWSNAQNKEILKN